MQENAKEGKRDLPVSHVKAEVLDLLPRRWRYPSVSGRMLSYPSIAVLTEPRKWEA